MNSEGADPSSPNTRRKTIESAAYMKTLEEVRGMQPTTPLKQTGDVVDPSHHTGARPAITLPSPGAFLSDLSRSGVESSSHPTFKTTPLLSASVAANSPPRGLSLSQQYGKEDSSVRPPIVEPLGEAGSSIIQSALLSEKEGVNQLRQEVTRMADARSLEKEGDEAIARRMEAELRQSNMALQIEREKVLQYQNKLDAVRDELDSRHRMFESQRDSWTSTEKSLKAKILELEQNRAADREIFNGEREQLKREIDSKEGKLKEKDGRWENIESEIRSKFVELDADKAKLDTQRAWFEKTRNELEERISSLQQDVHERDNLILVEQAQFEALEAHSTNQLAEVEKQFVELHKLAEEEKNKWATTIRERDSELNSVKMEYEAAKTKISEKDTEIGLLNKQLEDSRCNIAELNGKVRALSEERLAGRYKDRDVELLKEQLNESKNELTGLYASLKEAQEQRDRLQREANALDESRKEIKRLNSEVTSLLEKLSSKDQEIKELTASLARKEAEMDVYKREVEREVSSLQDTLKNDREIFNKQSEELIRSKDQAVAETSRLNAELDRSRADLNKSVLECEILKNEKDKSREIMESMEESMSMLRDQVVNEKSNIVNLEDTLRSEILRKDSVHSEELNSVVHSAEMQLREKADENDKLRKQVRHMLHMGLKSGIVESTEGGLDMDQQFMGELDAFSGEEGARRERRSSGKQPKNREGHRQSLISEIRSIDNELSRQMDEVSSINDDESADEKENVLHARTQQRQSKRIESERVAEIQHEIERMRRDSEVEQNKTYELLKAHMEEANKRYEDVSQELLENKRIMREMMMQSQSQSMSRDASRDASRLSDAPPREGSLLTAPKEAWVLPVDMQQDVSQRLEKMAKAEEEKVRERLRLEEMHAEAMRQQEAEAQQRALLEKERRQAAEFKALLEKPVSPVARTFAEASGIKAPRSPIATHEKSTVAHALHTMNGPRRFNVSANASELIVNKIMGHNEAVEADQLHPDLKINSPPTIQRVSEPIDSLVTTEAQIASTPQASESSRARAAQRIEERVQKNASKFMEEGRNMGTTITVEDSDPESIGTNRFRQMVEGMASKRLGDEYSADNIHSRLEVARRSIESLRAEDMFGQANRQGVETTLSDFRAANIPARLRNSRSPPAAGSNDSGRQGRQSSVGPGPRGTKSRSGSVPRTTRPAANVPRVATLARPAHQAPAVKKTASASKRGPGVPHTSTHQLAATKTRGKVVVTHPQRH